MPAPKDPTPGKMSFSHPSKSSGIARNDRRFADEFQRFLHGAEIAHAVIDDAEHLQHPFGRGDLGTRDGDGVANTPCERFEQAFRFVMRVAAL